MTGKDKPKKAEREKLQARLAELQEQMTEPNGGNAVLFSVGESLEPSENMPDLSGTPKKHLTARTKEFMRNRDAMLRRIALMRNTHKHSLGL